MEFDNNKYLFKIMTRELYATVLFGGSVPIAFLGVYQNNFLPLENYQYALLIVFLFALFSYLWYGQNNSFFSINTNQNAIIIKYFKILPKFINKKPKMVKIPKSAYVKYSIETSYFGRRKALYLFQNTKKGVVKYPPIYISALNEEEIQKLKLALQY